MSFVKPEPGRYRRLADGVEVEVIGCTGTGWNDNVHIRSPRTNHGVRLENFWKKYEPISDAAATAPNQTRWQDICPGDATGLDLAKRLDITAPLNENGERCPWPWEPQQLGGAPMGQYRCPYCLAMCVAGMEHIDYQPGWDEPRVFPESVVGGGGQS